MSVLAMQHVTMRFGGLVAVDDFNLEIKKGEIVGLIGPNGSGKTTVFNMITGFYKPTAGHIYLNGKETTGLRPDKITGMGLARIFQNSRLFKDQPVLDNVLIGHHLRLQASPAAAIAHLPGYVREERAAYEQVMTLLTGLGLERYVNERAGSLPYGLQRKLEVARALATRPSLLLLDEPATGMSLEETSEMMDFVLKLRGDFDLTILLIEHTMRVVMGICERIVVLSYGETIAAGNPAEIQSNQRVIEAYLGAS